MDGPRAELLDFDAVVRAYWPRVYRFALASLRDPDAAQTLAQDCFAKAHRARERFRGGSALQTWLMQIAVNLVRDYVRNRRLQFWRRMRDRAVDPGVADVADGTASPERLALLRETVRAVWAAAAVLPERQRTVFLLRFVDEMDLLEIAAVTGLQEGTVKIHLFRAVQAVRKRIGTLE